MVQDITRVENDRETLLAGVSHDLRTPITRLRLETEMANLPEDTRNNMISDLEQMETIVNQFMAYARRSTQPMEKSICPRQSDAPFQRLVWKLIRQ